VEGRVGRIEGYHSIGQVGMMTGRRKSPEMVRKTVFLFLGNDNSIYDYIPHQ
jgi:hypothetical protein